MNNPFNVGDIVKCVETGGTAYLTIGREYVVVGIESRFVSVENDAGRRIGMFPSRFKK